MTMLSKSRLKPFYRERLINKFLSAVNKNRDISATRNFLGHLLTPVEIDTFAKRLEIFKELRRNSTYFGISDKVKVTGATITKMNNIILKADEKFLRFLDELVEEDSREEHLEQESKYSKGSKQLYKRRIR